MKNLDNAIKLLVKEEFDKINLTDSINLYFDMDGVLASFDKALEDSEHITKLKNEFTKLLNIKPELKDLHSDALKNVFRGRQEDPLMARLKKAWNKQRNASYAIANLPGFFINLEVMPGAHQMVRAAIDLIGKKPDILTAPMEKNPTCKKEKEEWIKKNFSGMYNQFYCTQEKQAFAQSKYDILIDDRPKYTTRFTAAGGTSILHTSPTKSIKDLEAIIDLLRPYPAGEL